MYFVHKKDGSIIEVDFFDGGGSFVGEGRYEVHGHLRTPVLRSGEYSYFFCEYQDEIEKVLDEDGAEFLDYGNQYYPGHPLYEGD
jgi:hypothetical protein